MTGRVVMTTLGVWSAVLCGCGAAVSGAPPAPPAPAPAALAPAPEPPASPDEDDVRFMRGMLAHHAQALVMTALVPERGGSEQVRLLARRIERSQEDEMRVMREWLRGRGAAEPDPHAHHDGHHVAMPGMATPAELARLGAASGVEFDRLFLSLMIRHHEGALVMVEELFRSSRGGQESAVFQFASHVDGDQRVEIARMRALLARL